MNIFQNWKTSSAGITTIALSWLHQFFMLKAGTADETSWTRTITATVGGIGLIFAGDASKSMSKDEAGTQFLRKGDVKEIAKTPQATDMPQPAVRTVLPVDAPKV